MASLRSAILCLFVIFTVLQLSACLLEKMKGIGRHWGDQVVHREHIPLKDALKVFPSIAKRAATGDPVIDGDHTFQDGYTYASIHYSGGSSTVIFVLTFRRNGAGINFVSNLYRSEDYGGTFVNINRRLSSSSSLVLASSYFTSDFNPNLLLFAHATEAKFYLTKDEGKTFETKELSVSIRPNTIRYSPSQDGWLMALGGNTNSLYVTMDYGISWTKVDDNVAFHQWADPKHDENALTIYYTTTDPEDSTSIVNLFTSSTPFTTHKEFDPELGDHDGFLISGPYIFAQRTDAGKVNLYVSYMRKPFQLAKIPTPYNHQNYYVSDIDELQAMVVIEHEGGFYNLYLSDTTGVYFSLSLRDVVVENGIRDIEVINGVNGTLIANQYLRDTPDQQNPPIRSLISLDNGGLWNWIKPPKTDVNGRALNCEPPTCSLHLHMDTSAYARLGVYSTSSAPGIIVAHGSANTSLRNDPDLFISRDGGITWEETLAGSWGVNVADHGGLMVAARDYHQSEKSTELMYSCDEGYSWRAFNFTTARTIIWGVITEPGHHTTIMSLYGTNSRRQWEVFTIDFRNIFEGECSDSDYVHWLPWDERANADCVLGSAVTIERRNPQTCCLNGREYDREIHIDICVCTVNDFECDYGYARYGFDGPCLRDSDVDLPDPCAEGKTNYTASSGYRKVAGDICEAGDELIYAPFTAPCCGDSTLPPTFRPPTSGHTEPTEPTEPTGTKPTNSSTPAQSKHKSSSDSGPLIGTGVVIGFLAISTGVVLIILLVVALKFVSLRKRHLQLIMSGDGPAFTFHSDQETTRDDSALYAEEEDDDAPLVP